MTKTRKITTILLLSALIGSGFQVISTSAFVGPWSDTYTMDAVNGHSGYTTEWRGYDQLDKPIIVVLGYDPTDDDTAIGAAVDYQAQIDDMNAKGYDIIIFDYLDGDADISDNADNLAHFINYLDNQMAQRGYIDNDNDGHPDYELALAGASMGGIVARTMFVQNGENMGINIFATLDSPHYGVYISSSLSWVTTFISNTAGQQMLHGSDDYNALYGYLQATERDANFKSTVINPMNTVALTLSNGESRWWVSWSDELIHTKYHPVSSYVSSPLGDSDFIPYHSSIYADNTGTIRSNRWGGTYFTYQSTTTSYFDTVIQNPRDEHGGPVYLIQETMNYIDLNWE